MTQGKTSNEQAIRKSIKVLQNLSAANLDDDVVGAKAIEVAIRLTGQLCVFGLLDINWSKSKIADEIGAARDAPGQYAVARHTPEPERLAKLVGAYRENSPAYTKARRVQTPDME